MTPKTHSDWRALKLPMIWSIYEIAADENVDDWVLDLSTAAPDGVFSVRCGDGPYASGVTVEGGRFVPEPTAHACYEAAARAYTLTGRYGLDEEGIRKCAEIDHCYIEELRWDPAARVFELTVGS